jgi:tetratricopeptide (TPR) repeat protein
MSKTGLVNWPTGKWDQGGDTEKYAAAKELLSQSIRINPEQRTALYRLGLVSISERDYPSAMGYLERALAEDPTHPGIVKSLGLTYVWLGMYGKAGSLIGNLDDTYRELSVYKSWWLSQGRQDLSERAGAMLEILSASQTDASPLH